ncbi:MAG: Sec-independent protein translocase subunit TatA/TatB [Candidatus Acidiferrales bacterium]
MLSMPHLVIIFLVALIVFGPEKLPELARTFGKVMAEFKRATGDLRAGFDEHMRELERETRIAEGIKQQGQSANRPPPAETVTQAGTLPAAAPQATSAAPVVEPPRPESEDAIVPTTVPHSANEVTAPAPEPESPAGIPEKASDGDA